MNILITGGAGFIGSHLAEKYVQEGHIVKVLDNFSSGNVSNIRGLFNHKNFKLIRGDIRDKSLLQRIIDNTDTIFHLAAQINVDNSIVDPRTTFEINTLGTLNVLDVALEKDVKQVIYASTSEVYGSALKIPMDENHPLNPASPYGASKAGADRLCYSYYNTYKMNVSIIRNFNVFGPRQRSSTYGAVIPIFIRRVMQGLSPIIYGDGNQTRDYMYIEDAVQAYEAMRKGAEGGEVYNFGSGTEISIKDLADMIIRIISRDRHPNLPLIKPIFGDARPGEVNRLYAGTNLATYRLHFSPKYTLEAGLTKFLQWFRQGKYEEWLAYTSEENQLGTTT